jgi:hypothetical protein
MRWVTHEHVIFSFSLKSEKYVEEKREKKKKFSFFHWFYDRILFDLERRREKTFHWMIEEANYDWFRTKLYLVVIRLNYNRVKDV